MKEISLIACALGCSLLVGLHLIPHPLAVALGVFVALYAVYIWGLPILIVSIALFGVPFLGVAGSLFGIKPTQLVMVVDVLMVLLLSVRIATHISVVSRGLMAFFGWWLLFLCLYLVQYLLGPGTDHGLFCVQYLLIYGNLYVLAAGVAICYGLGPGQLLPLGVCWFAYHLAAMGVSALDISALADPEIGLRGAEGFDPISTARIAGLLLTNALCIYLFSGERLKNSVVIATALLLALPVAYFSYTRQVYVSVAAVCLAAFSYRVLRKQASAGRFELAFTVASFAILIGIGAYKIYGMLTSSESRVMSEGFNRTGLWMQTWALIQEEPLAGIGVGGFQLRASELWPHNWILEAWVELGVLGLVLVLIPVFVMARSLLIRRFAVNPVWLFMGIYFLLVAQVSGDIPRNAILLFFIGVLWAGRSIHSAPAVQRKHKKFLPLAHRTGIKFVR